MSQLEWGPVIKSKTWDQAQKIADSSKSYRLPTMIELLSAPKLEGPFFEDSWYWSSEEVQGGFTRAMNLILGSTEVRGKQQLATVRLVRESSVGKTDKKEGLPKAPSMAGSGCGGFEH